MNGFSPIQLLVAAVYLIPGFAWAVVATNGWRFLRTRRPGSQFFRLLPIVSSLATLVYAVIALLSLIPADVREKGGSAIVVLDLLNDSFMFMALAVGLHLARFFPIPEQPRARRAWLALNYGSSAFVVASAITFHLLIAAPSAELRVVYRLMRMLYQVVMIGLMVVQLVRVARPGTWRSGGPAFARRADVLVLTVGLLGIGVALILNTWDVKASTAIGRPNWGVLLDFCIGLALVTPLAVRILGEVVRKFLVTVAMLLLTGAAYFGLQPLRVASAGTTLAPLFDLATVALVVLVLVPGQSWLRAAIDHTVFRRSRRRREALQAFLRTLSPELGMSECCARALPEVTRVMQLSGAAIVLDDGMVAMHGAIARAPLERFGGAGVGPGAFPAHALVGYELRELPGPVQDAFGDTDIMGVIPIASPRRQWGLLFISSGLLGAAFSDEDEQVLEAFADQLALGLDGCDMLVRTVAVERSLAHAEKLAAIGELAARIAHEIRNPVTAARSLAQQLSREPASPLNAEHADLILTELERVERQIAALLRFARREEFHFEPVDLGELSRSAVNTFRSRLEAAGIGIALDVADDVVAPADREKLRQVLINLIENALDALSDAALPKQLSVVVDRANGGATIRVTDTGPGVSAEVLPHLFEPFHTTKENGTGLGLAIAKRIVEAHKGQLAMVPNSDRGAVFTIRLPVVQHH